MMDTTENLERAAEVFSPAAEDCRAPESSWATKFDRRLRLLP